MVNNHKPLDKTEAGRNIDAMLAEQNEKLKKEIRLVESELKEALRAKDQQIAEAMEELRLEHKQALQEVSIILNFVQHID